MCTMREALIKLARKQASKEGVDINAILRKAEHRISYSAKRAIEMYYPVWEKEPAWYLFLKCAECFRLKQEEIAACKGLLEAHGMVEEGA